VHGSTDETRVLFDKATFLKQNLLGFLFTIFLRRDGLLALSRLQSVKICQDLYSQLVGGQSHKLSQKKENASFLKREDFVQET